MLRILMVVLLIGCLSTAAFATDYFVSTTGDDAWPGTISQPWATFEHAIATVAPGDTINVRAGTYDETAWFLDKEGAPGAWITLRSYDGDLAAVITDKVYVHNSKYIRIEGFDISGGANALHIDPASGLFPRSANIEVFRCYVHDPSRGDTCKINNADYVLVEDCEFASNGGEQLVDLGWTFYVTLRRCYLRDFSSAAYQVKGGCFYSWVEDCVISHTTDADSKAIRFGGVTTKQYRNPDTTYASSYTVVKNTIIRDCAGRAAGTYECWYPYFVNNTVHNTGGDVGIINHHQDRKIGDGGSRHLFFYNNIFMDTDGDMPIYVWEQSAKPYEDWNTDYNNFWNAGNPIPSGGMFDPNQEPNSTFGNPNLANPTGTATTYAGILDLYRITSASTSLIDQGTSWVGQDPRPAVYEDIEGTPRPQGAGYDIGAFEYTGGPVAPVAEFSGNPQSGEAPLTVYFSDLSTGAPTSWDWTFGDGGSDNVQNPSHEYTSADDYTVSLTAQNAHGQDTETKVDYITVSTGGQPPVADFVGSPTNGTVPLTVDFTDQSTNSPTSWSWDFGDIGSSGLENPSHEYTAVNTYTVALTATNAEGQDTETKVDYITVTTGDENDYLPDSYVKVNGTYVSGDVTDVHYSDDQYLVHSYVQSFKGVRLDFTFNTGLGSLSSLSFTVEGKLSTGTQTQTVYVYNYSTSAWDSYSTSALTTSDTTVSNSVTNPGNYISGGTVEVRVQVGPQKSSSYDHYADLVKITAAQ